MSYQPGQHSTILGTDRYLELINNQGKIKNLRFTLNQTKHILGREPELVDLNVPEDWTLVSRVQAVLRKEGTEYRIYDGDGQKPSSNKLYINHSLITATEGYLLKDGVEIHISQNSDLVIQIRYFNPITSNSLQPPIQKSISLKQKSVLIGRDSTANLPLNAPTISRRHATIDTDNQGRYILKDHSSNGVFVNSQQVNGEAILTNGAKIRIGPYTLVLRDDNLEILDQGNHIRLEAQNLVLKTNDKLRIDNLSFAIEPGQFVALVGGSGAGKSTLMRILLGIEKITKGIVYLNGEDLQKNFNLYRNQIGYVPQDDVIHQELTVAEVLTYAAKLRLPPDINLEQIVNQALVAIKMDHRYDALISDLSGGQRKRVSIGVELLADPKLFFLDEPTSGLDPGLDKGMMQLLRELAHESQRTIILVTHATANITECDRIVFLGRGGKLCYFGTPDDALQFFEVKDFADIYIKLEDKKEIIEEYASKFRQSSYYETYIANQLNSQIKPGITTDTAKLKNVSFWQQWTLLTQRYGKLILRDKINLGISLLTAPFGISLITLAIQDKVPFILSNEQSPALALQVLFVFTCTSLWVGLSSSSQEIIKESAIYFRERLVNLGLFAYLGSKITILSGLALAQTLLIVMMIRMGFESPNPKLISWNMGLLITNFLTLFTSFNLGLLISAIVKNSSQANNTLPLFILPQIIFSGVLFKTESVVSKILSWLMISRWSVGAYGTILNINSLIPAPTKLSDGKIIYPPFKATSVYDPTWENLGLNWGMLLLHAMVYLLITFILQKRKDIFK